MYRTNIAKLRLLAFLEGMSFILLLAIGMPLKYMYNMPGPNLVIGMLHGILFIAYCVLVIIVRSEVKWNLTTTFWALLASFLPFATFVADAYIFKPVQLLNRKSVNEKSEN